MLEGHPDNASASVLGGLTVSWMPDGSGLDRGDRTVTASIALHPEVEVVVLVPETQLATRTARAVLPAMVPLAAAAAGAGRAALLVHALTSDPSHLHAATRDWLHQEARRPAYPETMRLVDALRAQGHAAVVSGAGPERPRAHDARRQSPSVQAPEDCSGWQRLTPGVPEHGRHRHRALTTRPSAAGGGAGWYLGQRTTRRVHAGRCTTPTLRQFFSASRCSAPMWFTVGQRQLAPVRLREVFAGSRTRGKDPSCQKPPPVLCLASPP